MDRAWTKPGAHARRGIKKKNRSHNRKQLPERQLRVIVTSILLCSIVMLSLLSGGSAGRRLTLFAIPAMQSMPDTISSTQREPADISILRVDVDEGVSDEMRIEVLTPRVPATTTLGGDEPRILIYHTHTTEAYTPTEANPYEESSKWRTRNNERNIVAVGELLAKTLREEYGCNVIHDITDHEPPKLSTAYNRSVETMEKYKRQYPSLTMFIDVHRDAGKDPAYAIIEGKRVARLMFVVGTGQGATGTGFAQMPDFESNYALALDITNRLANVNERLMRNIRVKTGRYNQHISNQCLLVEVGDNANTLEEALNAIPYLAKAIVESASGNTMNATPADSGPPIWAPQ